MNCSLINENLLDVARTIEQSAYEAIHEQLKVDNITIELIYVKSLCQVQIQSHAGYSSISSRLLEGNDMTNIEFFITVSQACTTCENLMFNKTTTELQKTIQDNSLSRKIQNNTNGTIESVISPNVTSSFKVIQRACDPLNEPVCHTPTNKCITNSTSCIDGTWQCVETALQCPDSETCK